MDDLYFRQIEVGPMANFVYMIGSNSTREALIVDPAWQIEDLLKLAEEDEMKVTGALITHTHADHVGGDMRGQEIEGVAELLEHCDTVQWAERQ